MNTCKSCIHWGANDTYIKSASFMHCGNEEVRKEKCFGNSLLLTGREDTCRQHSRGEDK